MLESIYHMTLKSLLNLVVGVKTYILPYIRDVVMGIIFHDVTKICDSLVVNNFNTWLYYTPTPVI